MSEGIFKFYEVVGLFLILFYEVPCRPTCTKEKKIWSGREAKILADKVIERGERGCGPTHRLFRIVLVDLYLCCSFHVLQ